MEEIKLSSKDKKILLYLEKYMDENKKIYNMLLEFIDVIGTFSNPVMLYHYNEIKDEKDDKYYAYFSDKEENIYVVCLKSNNRKDIDIIERQTNSGDEFYDLSLSKKTIIKKDNISLLKTKETYSFKNGRVITDNNTFYSIFLGNNIAYQLNITTIDSNININSLLKKLNEYDKELDFITIINIFGSIIIEDNINFQKADIAFYKDVKKCDSYSVDGSSSYSDSSEEKVLKK